MFNMKSICVFYFLTLCGYALCAMSDEEVKLQFVKILTVCGQDHPVEMSEIMKLEQLKTPTDYGTKCLLACGYKKMGTLKNDGKFDLEEMYKITEKLKKGDETAIINGKKLTDICVKVNDDKVSDGEKGCDRAALMFHCVVNNAPKGGLNGGTIEQLSTKKSQFYSIGLLIMVPLSRILKIGRHGD